MLQPRTAQHEARVDVAGEGIAGIGQGGLVAEHERRDEGRRVETIDAEVGGRIARMTVVVSAHQRDL